MTVPAQIRIAASYMRGGTSKGVFFRLEDLPVAAQLPDTQAQSRQTTARLAWALRAVVGKIGSVLRLLKGWYTFDGGLDYLVWKLERHSGKRIEVPARVRARPALHIWAFAWRLYRDGVFR